VITRRTFVKGAAALPVLPVVASGCGNDVVAAPIVDVIVGDDPADPSTYGFIRVRLTNYPDLAPGGAVTLRLQALPPGTRPFDVPPRGVLLIHRATPDGYDELVATRADCPHQGCPLGYSAKDDQIECPCHGSRFRASTVQTDPKNQCTGVVLHLPAVGNLRVYGTRKDGDDVVVDLSKDLCGSYVELEVDDGRIAISVAEYPVLAEVGGALVARPSGSGDRLIIARTGPAAVTVLSSVCTHRQCSKPIELVADDELFHCSCHGSEFDYEGRVLTGPATAPVRKYPATFDGTTIVIDVR
jgi:Rieske Fe-S protein